MQNVLRPNNSKGITEEACEKSSLRCPFVELYMKGPVRVDPLDETRQPVQAIEPFINTGREGRWVGGLRRPLE